MGQLDALFCCIGGGGLISGCSLTTKAHLPECKVYGVEPTLANKTSRSVEAGEVRATAPSSTIADGANNTFIGDMCFNVINNNVEAENLIDVSDEELIDSMRFLAEWVNVKVEPTGCLGLAGLKKMVQ